MDCSWYLARCGWKTSETKVGGPVTEVEERGRVPGPAAKEEKEIVGEGEGHCEQEKGLCMMC